MAASRVTYKKVGGNDAYSYAVLYDGRVVSGLTGLNLTQAKYYQAQIREQRGIK